MKKQFTVQPAFFACALVFGLAGFLNIFSGSVPPVANTTQQIHVFPVKMPASASFAGESVPLNDYEVRERLDRELIVNTYWQSQTLLLLKRSNRWFPVIEPILRKNNIPDDFKYLAVAGGGLTNAVSPAGATGFWQLLSATATQYGLEVDEDIDERYDVVKSTEAACRYLNEAYTKFGNWTMAAASYNIGITGIARQTERQQETGYYDLLLVEETSRYLLRIVALKLILSSPGTYGYQISNTDLYPPLPVKATVLDTAVADLASWAKVHGINYKTLKNLNPWMRQVYIENPTGKSYTVLLPGNGFDKIYPGNNSSGGRR